MSDVLRELQDDIRRDRARQWWGRHGTKVTVAIVVLAVAVGGWATYEYITRSNAIARTVALAQTETVSDAAARAQALEALAGQQVAEAPAVAAMAQLRRGETLVEAGELDGAIAAYVAAAEVAEAPALLRDFARLRQGHTLVGQSKWDEALAVLEPLTVENAAWRWSAIEAKALAQMGAGRAADALATLNAVPAEAELPAALRSRIASLKLAAEDAQ